MDGVDEAAVRATLTTPPEAGEAPVVAAADVAEVLVEDAWIVVTLASAAAAEAASAGSRVVVRTTDPGRMPAPDVLRRVHTTLRGAYPEAQVEVRAGTRVYRGGTGFGEGKHVVAVLGGKGGVGKSTLAVNLALTLSAMGVKTGLIDGDLNGPDVPHLLGIQPGGPNFESRRRSRSMGHTRPGAWRQPLVRYGVEVVSVGLEVPERFPPVISSRQLVSVLLRQFIFQTAWTADVLLIDAPPGTGEELQVMARELPLSGAVFITTPQDLAQMDAERTLTLMREHGVPVAGMVQNMASLTCPHCEQAIDLYSLSPRLREAGVEVLGRIPFDVQLSVTADQGRPLVLGDPRGPIAYEFARIGAAVRRFLRGSEELGVA